MKKLLSLFLSLTILFGIFTGFELTAYAATRTFTSGGLSVSLDTDSGVMTVSKSTNGNGRGADYQNTSNGRAPWYGFSLNDRKNYRDMIKSVVIQDGVIAIGSYWFYNCTNLTSVTIADSVDTIGDCAFRNCSSLTGIKLPKNCSWYYKELFLDCTSLKWAVLPENNNTNNYSSKIPDGTFKGCTSLEEVYIGAGYNAIDSNAFYNCTKLKGVVWKGSSISQTGSNAVTNVPSSCIFFSDNNTLAPWASANGKSASGFTEVCSDNTLKYSYNAENGRINFSGSGNITSTPWRNFHYFINDVSFADINGSYTIPDNAFTDCVNLNTIVFSNDKNAVVKIGNNAFSNCTSSTYWLDIPAGCVSVGSEAFANTSFNYIKIFSPAITIPDNAFTGSGYKRFFGLNNSGARNIVKAGQSNGYDWHYYCIADVGYNEEASGHGYTLNTIAPTCTEQGYDIYYCMYCDVTPKLSNYTHPLDHLYSKYIGTDTSGTEFLYTCNRCGVNSLKLNAVALEALFSNAISYETNAPYNQSNYKAQFDIMYDGYVNAKDFLMIRNAVKKINLTNKKTVIDTNTVYQTMDGFGASGAWWAQDIGRWDTDKVDRITELLYGETGAGLDIYRYNLGGGSENDPGIGDWRRRAEDFLLPSSDINNPATYDWNADKAAQNVLASAKRANPDLKVTLFSNSAPVSITDNGKAYCSYGVKQNLSSANYQKFANYVVNCAEHFIDEGYNVTCVSPINEPEWDWAANENGNCAQEGTHWDYRQAQNFYNNYMIPALQANPKLNGTNSEKVGISIWECAQLNLSERNGSDNYYQKFLPYMFSSESTYKNANANIRSYTDSFDTHSYWVDTSGREKVANDLKNINMSAVKKVRATEYCQMTNDANTNVFGHIQAEGGNTNGMTIAYGLALADIMYQDLTILNAVEWDWWTACSGGIYPDGLVYVDYSDPDNILTSKRLWAMGNYARFINSGAKRVRVTTGSAFSTGITTNPENIYKWADDWGNSGTDKNTYVEQSAYLNPDGSVVVVYINNSDTNLYTGFDGYSTLKTYVTDENRNLELFQSGNAKGKAVQIPAMSITTVVLK